MKRSKRYVSTILLLSSLMLLPISCGNSEPVAPVVVEILTSIQIKTEPTKVRYYVGDSVNFDGIEIEGVYSTGKKTSINVDDCEIQGATTISKGDRLVTINYQGFSASFYIYVEEKSTVKTLKTVDVDVLPNKVNYLPGETFDPTGMLINARYSDGSIVDVSSSAEITFEDDKTLDKPGVITVKATYERKFDTFQIYVRESEGLADSDFGSGEEGSYVSNMINDILTNHNYVVSLDSYIEYHKEDEHKTTYYNLNNKAYYNHDDESDLFGGLLYQKDQGFVQFRQNVETRNVLVGPFYSTSLEHDISDIYDVVIENILNSKWVVNSENSLEFLTSDYFAIATGCNFTGYAYSANLEAPENIIIRYSSRDSFYIDINFSVIYYDTEKGEMVKEPGLCTLGVTVSDAHNEELEAYIEEPTYIYEVPTSWSETDESYFNRVYGIVPPFPTGASYSFYFDEDNDYRGSYLYVTDYASGDISSSYRTQLEGAGFVQVGNDNNHYRYVYEKGLKITNYDVYLKYRFPTSSYNGKTYGFYYPRGEMYIEYIMTTETSVNTVKRYNKFVQDMVGPNVLPSLTFGSEVTAVTGFKYTEGAEYKFRQPQETEFHIASYADAMIDFNDFTNDLKSFGYTEVVYNSIMKVYNYFRPGKSSYVQVTALDVIGESNYAGVLEIRCQLYTQDY